MNSIAPTSAPLPPSLAPASAGESNELPAEFAVGTIVAGKYRVTGCLGTGGMGVVASAQHVGLGSRVALKIMKAELASDPKACARFTREGRLAASVEGEHCTRVYDVGSVSANDSGIEIPYLAMEHLTGEGLDQRLERDGAMPVNDVLYIMFQVFCALAEAHSLGLVHRDIKPANLFAVARPGDPLFIKVLDFGISKALNPDTDTPTSVTVTAPNTVLGSPEYMSPEQLQASPDLDARTDLWACGIVIFELLTRFMPFSAESLAELYANVLRTEPRNLDELASQPLPAGLSAAWLRCLEKSAVLRYQSVAELALALEPFADERARALLPQILAWSGTAVPASTTGAPPAASMRAPAPRSVTPRNPPASTQPNSGVPRWAVVGGLFAIAGAVGIGAASLRRPPVVTPAGVPGAQIPVSAELPATSSTVPSMATAEKIAPNPADSLAIQVVDAGAVEAGKAVDAGKAARPPVTGPRNWPPSADPQKTARPRIDTLGGVKPVE